MSADMQNNEEGKCNSFRETFIVEHIVSIPPISLTSHLRKMCANAYTPPFPSPKKKTNKTTTA